MERATSFAIFLAALVLLGFTVFGDNGLLRLFAVKSSIKAAEAKNQELIAEINLVRGNIAGLKHSDIFLEKFAREELGYARDDEYIYAYSEEAISRLR